jgi:hypothetical protein
MAKPDGYGSIGPFTTPLIIKTVFQEICAKEIDPETGKKKTMEAKVIELLVAEIKKHKPEFELPPHNGNGDLTCQTTPGN